MWGAINLDEKDGKWKSGWKIEETFFAFLCLWKLSDILRNLKIRRVILMERTKAVHKYLFMQNLQLLNSCAAKYEKLSYLMILLLCLHIQSLSGWYVLQYCIYGQWYVLLWFNFRCLGYLCKRVGKLTLSAIGGGLLIIQVSTTIYRNTFSGQIGFQSFSHLSSLWTMKKI